MAPGSCTEAFVDWRELHGDWPRLERQALVPPSLEIAPPHVDGWRVLYDRVFVENTRAFLEARFLEERDAAASRVFSEAERTIAERIGLRRD